MDRGGIDYVILSQTGPGVQAEPDAAVALRRARENNDFLVQQVARHPTRYGAFATIPMHDPRRRRRTGTLRQAAGLQGRALINGHTNGVYYDGRAYDTFWERCRSWMCPSTCIRPIPMWFRRRTPPP